MFYQTAVKSLPDTKLGGGGGLCFPISHAGAFSERKEGMLYQLRHVVHQPIKITIIVMHQGSCPPTPSTAFGGNAAETVVDECAATHGCSRFTCLTRVCRCANAMLHPATSHLNLLRPPCQPNRIKHPDRISLGVNNRWV